MISLPKISAAVHRWSMVGLGALALAAAVLAQIDPSTIGISEAFAAQIGGVIGLLVIVLTKLRDDTAPAVPPTPSP